MAHASDIDIKLTVLSRRWNFAVNSVAASPFLGLRSRTRLLRRMGLDIESNVIYPRCFFHTADVSVGARSLINFGCHIENIARVEIGKDCALGQFVLILTSTHEIGTARARAGTWSPSPVQIGNGSWIGARTTVLPGVSIGEGAVVAAGSVITKSCEPNGLYAGVPATRRRDLA